MFTVPWQKKKKKNVGLFSQGISEECQERAGLSINAQHEDKFVAQSFCLETGNQME